MSENLLVSVSVITYNQKEFIIQTLDSILRQQTNFDFEVIIGDDFSTDGTREILLDYKKTHPQIIKLILHPHRNPGIPGKLNFISTIEAAKGKYIALCDGDDYWTDQSKLQKQVNFLEANPDFAICFHKVKVKYESDESKSYISNENQKEVSTFEDLASGNYIHTPSCVFRNNLFNKFPDWFKDSSIGDYPLHLLNARNGKIKFLNEEMAVYRIHTNGVWSMQNTQESYRKTIEVVETCKKHFAPLGENKFNAFLEHLCRELSFIYFSKGLYKQHRKFYIKVWAFIQFTNFRSFVSLTIRYFLSFVPPVASLYKKMLMNVKDV